MFRQAQHDTGLVQSPFRGWGLAVLHTRLKVQKEPTLAKAIEGIFKSPDEIVIRNQIDTYTIAP